MQEKKRAVVTGVSGQLGIVLAELLLAKGYEVHGLVRDPSTMPLSESLSQVKLHVGDMLDGTSIDRMFKEVQPHEVYNLAAQSGVFASWKEAQTTLDGNFLGVVRALDTIRAIAGPEQCRVLNAGSSEMFGLAERLPIDEHTPIRPRTPYGTSKASAYWICQNYRTMYDMYAVTAILFNQESARRRPGSTTHRLTTAVSHVALGQESSLMVGDLQLTRDWGHAEDAAEAMWLALQAEVPDDYIVASGEAHTVRDLLEVAFAVLGIEIKWSGEGAEEIGVNSTSGATIVRIDAEAYAVRGRTNPQVGDPSRTRTKLGWQRKKSFKDTIEELTLTVYAQEASAAQGPNVL